MTQSSPRHEARRNMVPLNFAMASTWVFWIGILIGLGGFGLAYAGWIADRQTTAEIMRVESETAEKIRNTNADAQQRIAEVEAKTAPRRLTKTQRLAFYNLFHSSVETVRISYRTGSGTGDVGELITDILAEAHSAGAIYEGNGVEFGILRPGISFQLNPKDKDLLTRLNAFVQAIGKSIHGESNTNLPAGSIVIFFGSRTDGLP